MSLAPEDEVQIISQVSPVSPDVAITKSFQEILGRLDSNHQVLLNELNGVRRFVLDCFSSLILELNETAPGDSSPQPEDRLKRFLSRLGVYCGCFNPVNTSSM